MNIPFLTAEWRKLAMVNYITDPSTLESLLPPNTELVLFNNQCYISLLSFMFLNTNVLGVPIPFHRNFEEVNLRFYVRTKQEGQWKKGIVFIREFVSLPMVSLMANLTYHENYQTLPTRHEWKIDEESLDLTYLWKKSKWNYINVIAQNKPSPIIEGTEEDFIAHNFWGFTKKAEGSSQYYVHHDRWNIYPVSDYEINVNFLDCYGEKFEFMNHLFPHSVYLAEGSGVEVFWNSEL